MKHFLKIKLISLNSLLHSEPTSELNLDCKCSVLFKKIGNFNLLPGYYWPSGFKQLFYQVVNPSLHCGFVILQVQFSYNWDFASKKRGVNQFWIPGFWQTWIRQQKAVWSHIVLSFFICFNTLEKCYSAGLLLRLQLQCFVDRDFSAGWNFVFSEVWLS